MYWNTGNVVYIYFWYVTQSINLVKSHSFVHLEFTCILFVCYTTVKSLLKRNPELNFFLCPQGMHNKQCKSFKKKRRRTISEIWALQDGDWQARSSLESAVKSNYCRIREEDNSPRVLTADACERAALPPVEGVSPAVLKQHGRHHSLFSVGQASPSTIKCLCLCHRVFLPTVQFNLKNRYGTIIPEENIKLT